MHGPLLEVSTDAGLSLRDVFALAKELQLPGVEYMSGLRDLVADPATAAALSQEYGVPVTSIHEPLWLVAYAPILLYRHLLAGTKLFPEANTYVIHLSSVLNYLQQGPGKVVRLAELARRHNLTLAVESNTTMPILECYPKVTRDPEAFAAFCIKHGLKMTLDTSHITACGGDIVAFYETYHEHIAMIHLSDYRDGKEHLPLANGSLPLTALLGELRRTHYNGTVCIELEFPRARDTAKKVSHLAESVEFVRSHLF